MVTLASRQKLTIVSLSLYWIILFILSHIPIPKLVYQAQVSDKTLHFVAYMLLVFLLWFSVSPEGKVNWRKPAVWWVLLVTTVYGIIDEVVQGYVGRSCDMMDFLANATGMAAGLILFSFLSFWPAFLTATATGIFLITNVARANIAQLIPLVNFGFHLFAYLFFTLIWIRCISLFSLLKPAETKWFISSLSVPAALLTVVKFYSVISGRRFGPMDIVFSLAGIIITVTVFSLTVSLHRRYHSSSCVRSS